MTTRRNILKSGAGLAAILATGKAPAYIVKSMLAARNSIGMRVGGAKLPYDAEVEYLESTGTQYIDTGIVSSYANKVEMSFSVPSFSGEQRIFGQSVSDVYRMGYDSTGVFMSSGGEKKYRTAVAAGSSFDVVLDGTSFTINGIFVGDLPQTSARGEYNCYAFAWNRSPMLFGAMKLRSLKITRKSDGVLLRDFIPVRFTNELGQSEGAMYDRVSKQLFRNQGTGAFTIGPDKTSWVNPYVTDGLVAMWDGEWNAGGGVHDANATVWKDLSGNGYNFSLPQNVVISDDYITIPAGTILSNGKSASVASVEMVISASKSNAFFIGKIIDTGDYLTGIGLRYMWLYFGRTTCSRILTDNSIPFASYSLSDGVIYKNGDSQSISTYGNAFSDSGGFAIGAAESVTLDVRSVRFYSRTLTAAEIAANYAVDKARFNLP